MAEELGCCWALLAAEELPAAEHSGRGSPAAQPCSCTANVSQSSLFAGAHKATVNRRGENIKK